MVAVGVSKVGCRSNAVQYSHFFGQRVDVCSRTVYFLVFGRGAKFTTDSMGFFLGSVIFP